ncbi:MAG: L-serine ammonia-lyase, iron-sulfur-dependent subunit beta [Cyclobacteriaceae bacterium]|nr:L-serine ammonia-lyase, iron-sulfur-dependent subunit beta [Cyclobacteriaceae bacterium]MCH8514886.1 L-serine ammonia-lyase, iron-sulfur-dependent subunit beta [Cyclobacteriaceae bacterium]
MGNRSSVFDMIGPVMIGPSSSHTAGVVRIARAAFKIMGEVSDEADIIFYNSFARTYQGHGSDRAVIAGLLNMKTDDRDIKNALDIAKEKGFQYHFKSIANASIYHPNSIRIKLKKRDRSVEVLGESLGGGVINVAEVDGFTANFSARLHTLIIKAQDMKGSISYISSVLANDNCNIATLSVTRKGKNDLAALVFEMDSGLKAVSLEYIKNLDWVREVIYIPDIDL